MQQSPCGTPDSVHVNTSYVQRQNLTMRMPMRRFTRLTNAGLKKVENRAAAIAFHLAYYNLCRTHQTLRVTPSTDGCRRYGETPRDSGNCGASGLAKAALVRFPTID